MAPRIAGSGEGQNRTADTTIFSQGAERGDLGVVAGTFVRVRSHELLLVSSGFWWVWVTRGPAVTQRAARRGMATLVHRRNRTVDLVLRLHSDEVIDGVDCLSGRDALALL